MKPATRHAAATAAVLLGGGAVVLAAFVWSGAYDVGADAPHSTAVRSLLETLRERSVETRAQRLAVPADLGDDARVVRGAGNYDAMCAGCHLAPGMAATELSRGLHPQPPELAKERAVPPAEAFWVVKHGIKASGMPAWGASMADGHVWDLVALLQKLPMLDEASYQALVERSDGHSHGGGESDAGPGSHGSEAAAAADHHGGTPHGPGATGHDPAESSAAGTAGAGTPGTAAGAGHGHDESGGPAPAPGRVHVHADGRQHEHGAPRAASGVPRR